jgi:hypothetical protein
MATDILDHSSIHHGEYLRHITVDPAPHDQVDRALSAFLRWRFP